MNIGESNRRTVLGIDNSGYLTIGSDVEIEAGSYNTSNSNLWTKVWDYFNVEIKEEWAKMRQDRFTLDNLMSYIYGEQISKIPPKLYNDDAQVKYLDFGSLYTYCCHGSKEHQIRRWLRERIAYVDSMMGYYTSQDDQVTIRMNKTGYVEFEITPYIPLYLTVKWSNASGGTQTFRVGRGETKKFYYTSTTSTDQEILIPYASQIKRLDNLSNLNPSSCILSNATKLTNVEIHSTELYNINVTNNKYLRRVDLKDCTALGTVTATGSSLNLSNCKYLRYCNVYNTALTEVQLNTSGGSLIEIYYPKTIQNVQLIKQRLLETIGLPYGSSGAEIPTSLYNIDIEECPSIKKLNTSTDNSINNTFASMVYCNNLTLRNALDLRELNFDGFHRLTKVIIENMYNLQVVGFNNLLPKGETSTIKYMGLSNCPLLETIEMNCTSNDYEITFSDGAILNFGGLLALKTITSNCVLKGIKTIVLPLQLESMFFTNEYGEGYSTIQNLWSSAVCSVNTDGATPKATHVDSTYVGIDFAAMNLKNIDLGALVNIPKAINFSLSPTTVNPHFNLNRDGETYPYLRPIGTLDLSNYTESLARFFDGVDLDKLQIVCNNNLPQTDLSYCFYNSSFSSLSAIENLLTRVSNITNLDYCFYRTTIDSLNVLNEINMGANSSMNYTFAECPNIRTLSNITISRNVTSVEGMFKGCPLTSISNITVNVSGSIKGLFMGCSQLTTINTFRIPNVTDLSNVFSGCSNLTTLIGFELPPSVTKISNLFNGCYALTTIENFTFSSNITEANTWYPPYLETLQNITINSSAVKLTNCTTLTTIRDFTLGTNDCSSMFEGCTSITSDIELPSTIVNCSNMFKNCTSMTHIHSNWDNSYDNEITSTDCYSGCTAINNIDGVALQLNSYTTGLDEVPMSWGGYEFTKATTGLYKVNILSDNYTLNFDPSSKGFLTSNRVINWGDGTITTGETSHTYRTAGEYTIKGKVHCNSDDNTSIKESLVEVYTIPVPSNNTGILSNFSDCTNLTNVTIRNQDLTYSGLGDYAVCFRNCSSMQKIDLNGSYGLSLRESYSQFQNCVGILDLTNCRISAGGGWLKSHGFKEIILRNAKVGGTMGNFFSSLPGENPLVKVDLIGIDTSSIDIFTEMFAFCKNLTTVIGAEDLDLSSATSLASMFFDCEKLTEPPIKSIPSSVTNIGSMYGFCYSLLEDIIIPSHITDCHEMFNRCNSMTHIHSNWNESVQESISGQTGDNYIDVRDVASINIKFAYNSYFYIEGYDKDFNRIAYYNKSDWVNESSVIGLGNDVITINDNISYIKIIKDGSGVIKYDAVINHKTKDLSAITSTDCYSGCTAITHVDGENVIKSDYSEGLDQIPTSWGGYEFYNGLTTIIEVEIPSDNYSLSLVKYLVDITKRGVVRIVWGDGTSSSETIDSTTSKIDISHVYEKAGTYIIKGHFTFGNGYSNHITTELKRVFQICGTADCVYLFTNCKKLTYVNLSTLTETQNGKFSAAFKGCTALETIDGLEYIHPTQTNEMFSDCTSLTRLNGIQNLDMSRVDNAYNMFHNCTSLQSLDLNNWNVGNATDLYGTFSSCTSLQSLDLSNWNVSRVTKMNSLFSDCNSLQSLNLSSWNVSNVTDMSFMFNNCTSLQSLDLSSWDVSKVNYVTGMFQGCTNLSNLNVKGLNFARLNATYINPSEKMFRGCASLTTNPYADFANLDNFYTIDLNGCDKLTLLDFKNIPLRATKNINIPETVREITGLNLCKPTGMSFYGVNYLSKINMMWFDTSLRYAYWYYSGTKAPFETTFVGEIERIQGNEASFVDNYLKGFWVMTEASKTSFVNALKDYTGEETATLYGAAEYLSPEQIAIATAKNWTVT